MKRNKKNKGFTLIELLAVVAILVIVLGLVSPTLIKVLKNNKQQAEIERKQNAQNSGHWAEGNWTGWSPSTGYYPITSLPTFCPHPCI